MVFPYETNRHNLYPALYILLGLLNCNCFLIYTRFNQELTFRIYELLVIIEILSIVEYLISQDSDRIDLLLMQEMNK